MLKDQIGGAKASPFLVYKIVCLINGMQYVGLTRQKLSKRFVYHKSSARRLNRKGYLQLAFNEHGEDAFEIHIIEQCESLQHMCDREKHWIKELNTLWPNGYNKHSHSGAGSCWKHTPETIEKIRASKYGLSPSAETRIKLSSWQKGKTYTTEQIAKFREVKLGKTHTEESKNKMRLARLGTKRLNGKTVTKEQWYRHYYEKELSINPNAKRWD